MENKAVEWGYRRRVHEVEKQYYFWIVAGGMFYVLGRTTVNFTVKLSTSGSVQMGYINNSG